MAQVSSKQALKELQNRGWTVARQSGSHVTLKKPGQPHLITLPHPSKHLSPGVVRTIERTAGFRF